MCTEFKLLRALAVLVAIGLAGGCGSAPADDTGTPISADVQFGSGGDAAMLVDIADAASGACSPGENRCEEGSLQFCDPATGKRKWLNCNDSNCQQDGFQRSLGCGVNTKGAFDCLCEPCKSVDTACLSATVLQTCNLATGQVSVSACPSGQSCSGSKCKSTACTPSCNTGACGPGSDGCGGTCSCASGDQCVGGVCQKTCTKNASFCEGDVLLRCEADGILSQYKCSQASCLAAGYAGYSECGPSTLGEAACLCIPCTVDNNQCVDGKVLQSCDPDSGKLSKLTCTGTSVCFGGACVDPTCKPSCNGTTCGPKSDGCGGSCNCGGDDVCVSGYCLPPCSKQDDYCIGNELAFCDLEDGKFAYTTCSAAKCIAAGYVAYSGCGPSASGDLSCLCKPCTKTDNTCTDNKTAQVCDSKTGKLAPLTCPASSTCKAGACQVSCSGESDCADAEYCVVSTGACKSLDGASYTITIADGVILGDWGDTPDPYVEVRVNGSLVCTTATISDDYFPFWFTTCNKTVTLGSGSTLEVAIYDEDAVFDDFVGKTAWSGANLLALLEMEQGITAMIGSSGSTLTFYLDPQ